MRALIVFFFALAACGGNKPEVKTAQVVTDRTPATPRAPVRTENVSVSGEIARQCNIAPTIDATPKFAFDESELTAADRSLLDQIARCMLDGPLKGRSIRLTGRADARGEVEYNMSLGARRADSARSYLERDGVGETRVVDTSRGELDATGTDEAGWARDRRVDISLI